MKKLHVPRLRLRLSRKAIVIAVSVLVLASGSTAGYLWYRNYTSPESVLYRALAKAKPHNLLVEEYGKDAAATATSTALASKDGTLKSSGNLTCNAKLPEGGNLTMTAEFLEIQEKLFLQYTKLTASDMPNQAAQDDANQRMSKLTNMWIILDDRVASSMIAKQHGVVFGFPDAVATTSKEYTDSELIALLKQHKVVAIDETKSTRYGGREVIEYSILISRDAYGKFMDAVQPDMAYRDAFLDSMFDSTTEDMLIVIDKQTEEFAYSTYEMEHPCRSMITDIDPSLESTFPKYFTTKVINKDSDEPRGLSEPKEYINVLQYLSLLSEVNPGFFSEEEQ